MEKVSGRYCSLGLSAMLEDKDLAEMLEPALGRLAKSYLYLSWQRKRLVCMARNCLFCTCELLRDLDIRKGVLIFSESIEQAETLYGMLKDDYERSYFPLRREYFRVENWEYREQMIKKL